MSGSEKKVPWKKAFARSSTKEHKDKEKPTKHGLHKERSGSGSRGASGDTQKKSGYDDFPVPATFPAHVNPITITSTSTAAGKIKVCICKQFTVLVMRAHFGYHSIK